MLSFLKEPYFYTHVYFTFLTLYRRIPDVSPVDLDSCLLPTYFSTDVVSYLSSEGISLCDEGLWILCLWLFFTQTRIPLSHFSFELGFKYTFISS